MASAIANGTSRILRQRARQQAFCPNRLADEQDVALFDFDFAVPRGRRPFVLPSRQRGSLQDALVMIVHRDREGLLRVILADAMKIEVAFDLGRLRHLVQTCGACFFGSARSSLSRTFLQSDDAVVANVNARARSAF